MKVPSTYNLLVNEPAYISDSNVFGVFLDGGGGPLGEKQSSARSILEEVQSYEITYPTWLPPQRYRRSANNEVSQSPHLLSLWLTK